MTYGDQAYDPYFDREFRERREAPMTTTESPQGQPVPTEPIDDDLYRLLELSEIMWRNGATFEERNEYANLRRAVNNRLAERPDRAVARGDIRKAVAGPMNHYASMSQLKKDAITELITESVYIAMTTPTETTDAMEDV